MRERVQENEEVLREVREQLKLRQQLKECEKKVSEQKYMNAKDKRHKHKTKKKVYRRRMFRSKAENFSSLYM